MSKTQNNKSTGTFVILIAFSIGLMLLISSLSTYFTTRANQLALNHAQQESFEDIKDNESKLDEITEVSCALRMYDYDDALVVEAVQGNNQYLYTGLQADGHFSYTYPIYARVYHILKKVEPNEKNNYVGLDYYGYFMVGKWYGKDDWEFTSRWHNYYKFYTSETAYSNSFSMWYSGTIKTGDAYKDAETTAKGRDYVVGDWEDLHADYVVKMKSGVPIIEKFFYQLREKMKEDAVSTSVYDFDERFFSAYIDNSRDDANQVRPEIHMSTTMFNYLGSSFFNLSHSVIVSHMDEAI